MQGLEKMQAAAKPPWNTSFTFILNPIETDLALPYELIPDHYLRRATEEEAERIQEFVFTGGMSHIRWFDYGEHLPDGGRKSPTPENWKCFVIDGKPASSMHHLVLAGNLLEKDISLGPQLGWCYGTDGVRGKTGGGNMEKIAQFSAKPHEHQDAVEITEQTVREWRQIECKLQSLSNEALRPHRGFETLRSVSQESPLFALGLFALIESIITHDPHDQFDSLSHQVSTKMVLLSRRFKRRLAYELFDCSPVKLWKKLYDYRSCIAHGASLQFKSGNLASLKSDMVAHGFLTEALKLLLLQLITEPELLQDLKEC